MLTSLQSGVVIGDKILGYQLPSRLIGIWMRACKKGGVVVLSKEIDARPWEGEDPVFASALPAVVTGLALSVFSHDIRSGDSVA